MKIKPIHKIRIEAIIAAIWKNENENGGARFNVQLSRIYKDDEGKWKSTESFGPHDLLVVAKVADQAHSWINQQEQEEINRILADTKKLLST